MNYLGLSEMVLFALSVDHLLVGISYEIEKSKIPFSSIFIFWKNNWQCDF